MERVQGDIDHREISSREHVREMPIDRGDSETDRGQDPAEVGSGVAEPLLRFGESIR